MVHHASCTPNYPEKLADEAPQAVQVIDLLDDNEASHVCVDCGAFEVVKKELKA